MLLVGITGSSVGLRVPVAVYKAGAPFPCQHHNCGCLSADQCWGSCCCYSTAEMLAWARVHHVEPHGSLDADEHEGGEVAACDHDGEAHAAAGGCCSKTAVRCSESSSLGCEAPPARKSAGCCGPSAARGKARPVGALPALLARPCRGLNPLWTVLAEALVPRVAPEWSFAEVLVGTTVPGTPRLTSNFDPPPVPPPIG